MADRPKFVAFVKEDNRLRVARRVYEFVMQQAMLNDKVAVTPANRSLEQNAMMHGLYTGVARQELYLGRQFDAVQWKTLFISGHAIATGLGADMVPGLEGEFVNVRESSSTMSKERMSSLIEYIQAYCAQHGIQPYQPKGGIYEPS